MEEIKAEGGITFAQDTTAQHDGMPKSAIASGCVDFVMSPDEIAREIVSICQHPYASPDGVSQEMENKPNLAEVVQILCRVTDVDFTGYRFSTLYRRVTRRMVFQKMERLTEYVQEAYSLAMVFMEAAEVAGSSVSLQLFASDLNAAGIEKAKAGIFPKSIAQEVSPECLRRFFTEVDGRYRINKTIRDAGVFSRHNVLADPRFSRMDLISCRNLLIYLEPVLQQKIMPALHYALKSTGCLWLGGSETIGSYRNLFDAEDAKHKIYVKKSGSRPGAVHFPLTHSGVPRSQFTAITAPASDGPDLYRVRPHPGGKVRPAGRACLRRHGNPPVQRGHGPLPCPGSRQGQP
ncbi:MAG: CheR family methyltransferase [Planctomycetaceae bacterium]